MSHSLFEVSWEVCNKVGGIHTVISTKAKTMVERYGDDYITLGPWLMSYETGDLPFEESSGFEDFSESCREIGIPVRVGRWTIPGKPRTILVEFSGLYEQKDGILAGLWERHQVDSLTGGWDYDEPVLFGNACGMVIEKWWREYLAPYHGRAVAHFHEWMTAPGMLYLQDNVPPIGTVFTTHATMLGRAVAATGQSPQDGLMGREPEDLAANIGLTSKHSLEGVAARKADVFTTVSEITADEAEVFHRRRAKPILPNGIDLDVIDEIAGEVTREAARGMLENLASRFLGRDVSGAAMFAISGRYEFHNKGIDLFLDALAALKGREGRQVLAFVLVPAGHSGLRNELQKRLASSEPVAGDPVGISTHNLFDEEQDPVHRHCRELGLDNAGGSRVSVIQVPIYLGARDGLLNLPYEAVLRAMDLTCFPSFYEPWGYTPEESLAVGVPTITTDYAGFGRWVRASDLGPEDGVYVLSRVGIDDTEAAHGLEDLLESFLGSDRDREQLAATCRATAMRTAWADLARHYYEAYDQALDAARRRLRTEARPYRPRVPHPEARSGPADGPRLVPFNVSATLPPELEGLQRLAANYWWSWDAGAVRLFVDLAPARWEACAHNPVRFLREVFPEDLKARAGDADYVARLHRVLERMDAYLAAAREDDARSPLSREHPVAYFSAEFAVHESLHFYSGGLGVLAGDHLKSASDLNVPLVAVGLFYRRGYMKQRLTASGDQLTDPEPNDPRELAMKPVLDASGRRLEIELRLPSSELRLQAWEVSVGRVPLYLLDSDLPDNRAEDRTITAQLYGGDHENRLRQEIVLGRGGVRLLAALGIEPAVWHCNEGHAAFLSLERVRGLIRDHSLTFDEAREVCRGTTVFTTHTPVPAGHDRFGEDLIRRYFSDAPSWVGVPWERFYELGRAPNDDGQFNMTYLATNFASVVNGVSELHGQVSKRLLHPLWPKLLESEVPVAHVTNGIHLGTWGDPALGRLLAGDGVPLRPEHFEQRAKSVDASALWSVRTRAKERLLARIEANLERSFRARNDRPALLRRMIDGLDSRALWIGFARRFAPYKRAHLMFHDPDRLAVILSDEDRPVRIVIAGKAHPQDEYGQNILRSIVERARSDRFTGKLFFVENYDVELARSLVQGVDVWLNTPTRPLEASGTSGMKVAAAGGLNVSVQDGWWIEAANGTNGWSIGGARVYDDQKLQDEMDATTLYGMLEDEIVPLFFDVDVDGVPQGWLERVRDSLATIPTVFNTDRMVEDYVRGAYAPLAESYSALTGDRHALARTVTERHGRIRRGFRDVRVLHAEIAELKDLKIGDPVEVRVRVDLGPIAEEELAVELVLGHSKSPGDLLNGLAVPLAAVGERDGSVRTFEASHVMERCGTFAYGIRIRPCEHGPLDFGLRDLAVWA